MAEPMIVISCLILGFLLGHTVGEWGERKYPSNPPYETIEQCEQFLPRNERCVLVAVKGGEETE